MAKPSTLVGGDTGIDGAYYSILRRIV